MKIAYKHLIENLKDKPSLNVLSSKLFQLGHEHEIEDEIFNIEITPNRGDCLSLNGILRELSIFFELNCNFNIYKGCIDQLDLNFENKAIQICPKVSFLKIEINNISKNYKSYLDNYFKDLHNNKVNFFTDISNYLSYEFGQPTHCYDFNKMDGKISLEKNKKDIIFETLLNQKLNLNSHEEDCLFYLDGSPINFAGVIGGKGTSCSNQTKVALVECAFFEPEAIIGKTIKFDIQSDAAYKFERGVDYNCQELIMRRFIQIVKDHADIASIALQTFSYKDIAPKQIIYDHEKINSIVGYKTSIDQIKKYLNKLGFVFKNNKIDVPYYRNDISNLNDIAEEVARIIGYDNIPSKIFNIENNSDQSKLNTEKKLKAFLVSNGFSEVINFPFTQNQDKNSIVLDNPLDSNKPYMRTTLKESLIKNLLYNERRQKDSIKIFEISNIYFSDQSSKKVLGIIGSGRLGKNYKDFSKKIDMNFFQNLLSNINLKESINIIEIDRDHLDSKIKSPIFYMEIDISNIKNKVFNNFDHDEIKSKDKFIKYFEISEFPSTYRDISFSIKDSSKISELVKMFKEINDIIVKDVFIFDFYENKKIGVTKIGFRIIFQSFDKTLTDIEVDNIMTRIINDSLKLPYVDIPGLTK